MVSDSRNNCLCGVAWELIAEGFVIVTKIDVLESGLLGNELREEVYVAGSFYLPQKRLGLRVWVPEPWIVTSEIEVGDGFNIGIEKGLENNLTDVLISVFIMTESQHVEHFDRRILLDDQPEKTNQR